MTSGVAVARARHRRYPAYRDSGVEWLGEIPAHWTTRRLKDSASINPEGLGENTDGALEFGYVDIGSVNELGEIERIEPMIFESAPSRARRVVRPGDTIVSTVRTYLRAIAQIPNSAEDVVVSTGFAVIRSSGVLEPRFAFHALRAPYFVERVVAHSAGVSFPAINESEMATFRVAVPPQVEQRQIADFLDRETSKIDALIAKKEELVQQLDDQVIAAIGRIVTHGLSTQAHRLHCGSPWLQSVPSCWQLLPLRRLIWKFVDYRGQTPEKSPTGVPLVTARNVKAGRIDLDLSREFIAEELYESWMVRGLPQVGDLLLTTEAPLGEVALVSDPNVALAQRIILLKCRPDLVRSRFLLYWFLSAAGRAELETRSTGSTALGIKASHLREVMVAVPTLGEQDTIAAHLDHVVVSSQEPRAAIANAIETLLEFRSAIISAAVTGRIDVREEVA
jgi:type I restriction enzyme S subunit